ncbi:hypothetical protein [Streptomyces mirabilis]
MSGPPDSRGDHALREAHPEHPGQGAYNDAGYFAKNVRTTEVVVDRDAVASGAAASGEPWQYYDLGRDWCTYTFFEQCQHRMACARCAFYAPKESSQYPRRADTEPDRRPRDCDSAAGHRRHRPHTIVPTW